MVQWVVFPNSDFPYVDAVFVLSCVPSSHLIHFPYWSCQIDPTPSSIDPTPSPSPIDPTQSLIDPTSVILVYFHGLHCSNDPIPTRLHLPTTVSLSQPPGASAVPNLLLIALRR